MMMPDEPDNEMDEVLRRYARAARTRPEVRMHPATRQMLQGEVKRTYARRAASRGWFSGRWWRRFWPYLAVTAVLALIFADFVLPRQAPEPELKMAQNTPPPTIRPENQEPESIAEPPTQAPEVNAAKTGVPPAEPSSDSALRREYRRLVIVNVARLVRGDSEKPGLKFGSAMKGGQIPDYGQENFLADFIHILRSKGRRHLVNKPPGQWVVAVEQFVPSLGLPAFAPGNQLRFRMAIHPTRIVPQIQPGGDSFAPPVSPGEHPNETRRSPQRDQPY